MYELITNVDMICRISETHSELQAFIRSQPHGITEFDETLIKHLLERVTVFGDYLVFRFKSRVEIVVEK